MKLSKRGYKRRSRPLVRNVCLHCLHSLRRVWVGMLRRCAQVPALSRNYRPVGFKDKIPTRQLASKTMCWGVPQLRASLGNKKARKPHHDLHKACASHPIYSAKKTFTVSLTRELATLTSSEENSSSLRGRDQKHLSLCVTLPRL